MLVIYLRKKKRTINYRELKTKTLDQLNGQAYKKPGSDKCPGDFAVPVDEIDWSKYDIDQRTLRY